MSSAAPAAVGAAPRPRDYYEALTSRASRLPEREKRALSHWASTFFPYQRKWIFEPARFAIYNKSRQVGISHATAAASVLWAIYLGEATTIISLSQPKAEEVVELAVNHVKVLKDCGSQWASRIKYNKQRIKFYGGGKVVAVPSTGARGGSGNVFFDEFAFMENAEKTWDASAPAATLGRSKIRIVSTPNGAGNIFHKMWTDPEAREDYETHQTSIADAIREGYDIDPAVMLKSICRNDKRLYNQNFGCSFLDGELQYYPTDLIDGLIYPYDRMPSVEGECYGGLDFGRTNDLTSLVTCVKDGKGVLWVVDVRTMRGLPWDVQMDLIRAAAADWNWRRLCVDATGIGSMPAETLQKELGRSRVEACSFTNGLKEDLATGLYQTMSEGDIWLLDDEDLRKDLISIRRVVTQSGNVVYDAPRTPAGHADRAWGLMLARRAASSFRGPGRTDFGPGDFRSAA